MTEKKVKKPAQPATSELELPMVRSRRRVRSPETEPVGAPAEFEDEEGDDGSLPF
jgi:hypothetical protein